MKLIVIDLQLNSIAIQSMTLKNSTIQDISIKGVKSRLFVEIGIHETGIKIVPNILNIKLSNYRTIKYIEYKTIKLQYYTIRKFAKVEMKKREIYFDIPVR